MEVVSKLEIGTANGKAAPYHHYKYICRLHIPIDREQFAIVWLCEREAKILSTTTESPYFIIIFATSNGKLLKSIDDKYEASEVDARVLYEKVKVNEECFENNEEELYCFDDEDEHPQSLQDKYSQDVYREYFDYIDSIVNSSESGWFYSDPDHSSYELWKLDDEDDRS
jgi:hypothetical protein